MNSPEMAHLQAAAQAGPTTSKERSFAIDVLRGVALLGILMMNIDNFGTTMGTHDIPIAAAIPAFEGPHASLNFAVVLLKWLCFEGKMRGIFSMLFGAGVLMLTSRAERRGAGADIADIYARRNIWLLVFGFLHGCFIWSGDILFEYALVALIALYPCRKLKPKTLMYAGTVVSLVFGTYAGFTYLGATKDWSMQAQVKAIVAQQEAGLPASAEQQQVLQAWDKRVKSQTVTKESVQADVAHATRPYWQGVAGRLQNYIGPAEHFLGFVDPLGMMLIGMGLYQIGFLTAERSYKTYAWTAAICFLISTPIYVVGLWKAYQSGFNFLVTEAWVFGPYFLTRELGTLAMASVVLMLIKSGWLGGLQRAFANVGKMALSNYILTNVLCQFIFLWGPWQLFGKFEYYQLNYFAFAIWGLNLCLSTLWLRAFQFGPLEWVWRSLTYVKLQPMRK